MAPDGNALIARFGKEAFYAVFCGAILSSYIAPQLWSYASTGTGTATLLKQATPLMVVGGGISLMPFFIYSYFAVERRGGILAFAGLCWVATLVIVARIPSNETSGSALYWLLGATLSLSLTQSLFLIFAKMEERT